MGSSICTSSAITLLPILLDDPRMTAMNDTDRIAIVDRVQKHLTVAADPDLQGADFVCRKLAEQIQAMARATADLNNAKARIVKLGHQLDVTTALIADHIEIEKKADARRHPVDTEGKGG